MRTGVDRCRLSVGDLRQAFAHARCQSPDRRQSVLALGVVSPRAPRIRPAPICDTAGAQGSTPHLTGRHDYLIGIARPLPGRVGAADLRLWWIGEGNCSTVPGLQSPSTPAAARPTSTSSAASTSTTAPISRPASKACRSTCRRTPMVRAIPTSTSSFASWWTISTTGSASTTPSWATSGAPAAPNFT